MILRLKLRINLTNLQWLVCGPAHHHLTQHIEQTSKSTNFKDMFGSSTAVIMHAARKCVCNAGQFILHGNKCLLN